MSDYAASLRALVERATPGPWRLGRSYIASAGGGRAVAPLIGPDAIGSMADARLIAAAPSLALSLADAVEALELAWEWIRWFNGEGERDPEAHAADVGLALARITSEDAA